jgi:acyl dehydratase
VTTSADELPQDVTKLCGEVQYEEISEIPVEHGYIWTSCASVENENPIFWDEGAAEVITGGPIAPPSMVSVWFRPHHWAPGRTHELLPLQVHFDLKERFGLPEAVMTDDTIVFHEPVRVGDLLRTHQVLRSVSGPKTTKLGEGRFWVIDVVYTNQRDELVAVETYTGLGYRRAAARATPSSPTAPTSSASGSPIDDGVDQGARDTDDSAGDVADNLPRTTGVKGAAGDHSPRLLLGEVTAGQQLPELRYKVTATTVVLGALATRDWRPMHHDKDFAIERNGTRDIFLNTPNQAAWFERYLTDWTGPHGRLARIGFRMKGSVFPGDTMVMRGEVVGVSVGDDGCGWADLSLELAVGETVATTATARVALPVDPNDNPWFRRSERWNP